MNNSWFPLFFVVSLTNIAIRLFGTFEGIFRQLTLVKVKNISAGIKIARKYCLFSLETSFKITEEKVQNIVTL